MSEPERPRDLSGASDMCIHMLSNANDSRTLVNVSETVRTTPNPYTHLVEAQDSAQTSQ